VFIFLCESCLFCFVNLCLFGIVFNCVCLASFCLLNLCLFGIVLRCVCFASFCFVNLCLFGIVLNLSLFWQEIVLLPLLYPELFAKFASRPPRGVLFHGPPGTGKTLVAKVTKKRKSFTL
jgi:hypothetical protein